MLNWNEFKKRFRDAEIEVLKFNNHIFSFRVHYLQDDGESNSLKILSHDGFCYVACGAGHFTLKCDLSYFKDIDLSKCEISDHFNLIVGTPATMYLDNYLAAWIIYAVKTASDLFWQKKVKEIYRQSSIPTLSTHGKATIGHYKICAG